MRIAPGAFLAFFSTRTLATPSSRLTYERGIGAELCPDESTLRRAVEQRLGYDPFFPWADRTMVARIRADATGLHGTVELLDAAGLVQGSRELSAPAPECAELVAGMALAISIAIDPTSVDRTRSPGERPEPTDDTATDWASARTEEAKSERALLPAARDVPRPPARRETTATPFVPELDAGVAGAIGLVPGRALGPIVGAALRKGAWSFGLEGRYLFSVGAELAGASVSSSVLEGAVLA
jgi:hypothetical protein